MTRWIIYIFSLLFQVGVYASSVGITLDHAGIDLTDKTALQRGAKLYMNYCSGCHSLKYLRYSQMAKGLGLVTFDGELDRNLLFNNLVFTNADVGAPIKVAMPAVDAREWFGKVPPDLSLVSRVRGADWLYTYLRSFYEDTKKPFNANNWLFPDVAMPNVLAPLQGIQVPVYHMQEFSFGGETRKRKVIGYLQNVKEGEMSEHQFDAAVKDIVTFLAHVGEPVKLKREQMGIWVLLFLIVLLCFAYALKKSFWKNLHK